MSWQPLLGYGTITGMDRCPCNDGNHISVEQDTDDPLHLLFRCWCGRTREGHADNIAEVQRLATTRSVSP